MIKLPEELQYIQNSLKKQKTTDARMDGKVCVVTGATSGVGYQAARRLAEGGTQLVMVCRNREKAESNPGGTRERLWLLCRGRHR